MSNISIRAKIRCWFTELLQPLDLCHQSASFPHENSSTMSFALEGEARLKLLIRFDTVLTLPSVTAIQCDRVLSLTVTT